MIHGMNEVTSFSATNAPVTAAAQSVLLSGLNPSSPVFGVIDGALMVILLMTLPGILRFCLHKLAGHEADDSYFKSFLSVQLIVLLVAVTAITPLSHRLRIVAAVPLFLAAVLLLRYFCWLTMKKAILVMLAFTTISGALGGALFALENSLLPKNRRTLVTQLQQTLGFIDTMSGKEGAPVFSSNTLHNAKMALKVEQQAIMGAIMLLKDTNSINELTGEHTANLKAMDLITDGKMPTPEQLKELGITDEEATRGRAALVRASGEEEISEQDVKDLAQFMKSVRHDKSEPTAADIAFAIRRARKLAGPKVDALIAASQPGGTGGIEIASAILAAPADEHPETSRTSDSDTNTLALQPAIELPPTNDLAPIIDPLASLAPGERAAWGEARNLLHMTGSMKNSGGAIILVNGTLIGPGQTIQVTSKGRSFTWRLVEALEYGAEWEPVLDATDAGRMPDVGPR
jgi:hypothetical protein